MAGGPLLISLSMTVAGSALGGGSKVSLSFSKVFSALNDRSSAEVEPGCSAAPIVCTQLLFWTLASSASFSYFGYSKRCGGCSKWALI